MTDIGSATSTNNVDRNRRMAEDAAKAAPTEAGKAAAPRADPVELARANETRALEARNAGAVAPRAADGAPLLPRPRPDTSPDIKINPRRPMGQGAGMGQQRTESKDVKTMQNRLQELGYSVGRQVADGKFGPNTEAGVKDFQKANGLPETGKVDKATWDKMRSRDAVKKQVNNDPVAGTMLDPSQQPGFYSKWDEIARNLKAGAYK